VLVAGAALGEELLMKNGMGFPVGLLTTVGFGGARLRSTSKNPGKYRD